MGKGIGPATATYISFSIILNSHTFNPSLSVFAICAAKVAITEDPSQLDILNQSILQGQSQILTRWSRSKRNYQ